MSRILVDDVVRAVAARYDVTPEEIRSEGRAQRIVRPRQRAYWLARRLTSQSLPAIGRQLGGKDHTSVMHGCRLVEEARQRNPALAEELGFLELAVRADAGRAIHPADKLVESLDLAPIAASVLSQRHRHLRRDEAVALARGYLTLLRRAEATRPRHVEQVA